MTDIAIASPRAYAQQNRALPRWLGAMLALLAIFLCWSTPAFSADDFLDPEVAFKFSAKMVEPGVAEVHYDIADGYYLYRERLQFKAEGATLGKPELPQGKIKFDETFQKSVETYRHSLTVRLPVQAAGAFTLKSTAQGCADQGLCYSPMESVAQLSGSGGAAAMSTAPTSPAAGSEISGAAAAAPAGEADSGIAAALKSGKLTAIAPLFLLLGLALAFTPCVLPMVPILSSIIVGEGTAVSRSRGLFLSFSYVLGMALVYTALGIAAGLAGEGLAASLQKPWVLLTFGALMVVLSLSMFDVYQLQVPGALQSKLSSASDGQKRGKMFGVFVMGAISALIVGPCVAAPLASALVYISQTRDVVVGGTALFSMAMGMGVPLLLVGISAGSLLPRAGLWMVSIKRFFGVLMLGMALWLTAPALPAKLQMAGWASLLVGYGVYLLFLNKSSGNIAKSVALVSFLLGATQLVGVATGGTDVLAPLAHLSGKEETKVSFVRVHSVAELDQALAQSKGKQAMLDFYADWCVSCKEMEKLTFTNQKVKTHFDDMLLLQVDVTANSEDDKALLKRFNLFGPPGIIFFDKQGKEIQGGRVIGYQDPDKFLGSMSKFGAI